MDLGTITRPPRTARSVLLVAGPRNQLCEGFASAAKPLALFYLTAILSNNSVADPPDRAAAGLRGFTDSVLELPAPFSPGSVAPPPTHQAPRRSLVPVWALSLVRHWIGTERSRHVGDRVGRGRRVGSAARSGTPPPTATATESRHPRLTRRALPPARPEVVGGEVHAKFPMFRTSTMRRWGVNRV
jgi:hypothetical protein